MRPETKYVEAGDGLIAYQVVGDGPIDLVYINGMATHLDMRWESPAFAHFLERLGSFARVISFDRRGAGLSDGLPGTEVPTWEVWVEDLRIVLDAVSSTSAAIFGVTDAGPMAVMFAATYPERTRGLILGNTSARLKYDADDYQFGFRDEELDAIVELFGNDWGTRGHAIMSNPSLERDHAAVDWLTRYSRASMTPRQVAKIFRGELDRDVRSVLPSVKCPTLVVHSERCAMPLDHGRYLAENIDGARLVMLPTSDIGLMFEVADDVLAEVEEFLTHGASAGARSSRFLTTVVFTDLVDSSRQAAATGDQRWQTLLARHDERMAATVQAFGGRVWKSTGDGAMASFDSPGRAVRALMRFHRELDNLSLSARAGVHTGEVEQRSSDDIGGLAVNIAARVMSMAGADEVLVSRTVVDLVIGSDLAFEDRGEHELKGIPGSWHLYSVAS